MHAFRAFGAAALVLAACGPQKRPPSAKSSGSIAISLDDSTLFVADADHGRVTVIDAKTRVVSGHVPVGSRPERVLVAEDGAVFVTNRGERTVMRIAPSPWAVEATARVGAEPVGMALSPGGEQLYVANSMSGSVTVLDSRTLTPIREMPVGGQPWAISVSPDGKTAFLTDFGGGNVAMLDLRSGAVLRRITLAQRPGVECPDGTAPARTPAQAADVVLSPDGSRAYVAHVQSRTTAGPMTNPLALAVAPALSTVETAPGKLLEEPARSTDRTGFPPAILATNLTSACQPVRRVGMDAPSSLVVDGSGEWIFVADHNSNAIAVVSSTRMRDERFRVPERGIYDVVRVGARPTGVAVTADLKTAFVHNSLDYTVSVVENRDHRLLQTGSIPFASSELPVEVERGRRLFYSAVDPRVTQPELGGVSCSSCHPEGRADGLSWSLPQSGNARQSLAVPGPRNTQPLWGVLDTAPYHWEGIAADLPAFSSRMVTQMGGGGLSEADLRDLTAFLGRITPPDNPNRERQADADLVVGRDLFSSNCASCHSGPALTDGMSHLGADSLSLDTPSLRGLFATPPYLHDGSAHSLRQVFLGERFGVREHDLRGKLSSDQARALEVYLTTL